MSNPDSMEKIILKPSVRELIYKNGESDTNFDVQSYQGSTNQEKLLGSLFIVSHIKYTNEDLAYAVSLISSLAKREYYSEASLQEQNSKASFERTLKKLNEVLEDFFKNKDFKLNIGLLALSGENIFVSRLGKFKIALARDNDYIDVLNNIDLFSKDSEDEQQFSNIISGKLRAGDKFFAYFPAKAITLREKMLNPIFVKENQETFAQKIDQLANNATNFSCCGLHIDVQQIKEIPVQFTPKYSMPSLAKTENKTSTPVEKPATTVAFGTDTPEESDTEQEMNNVAEEQPKIIPAELSVTRRGSILTPLADQLSKLASIGRLPQRSRSKIFVIIAAIVIIPLLLLVFLRGNGNSAKMNSAISKARDSLKLAQAQLTQNKPQEARSLIQAALLDISSFPDKKVISIKQELNNTLDSLDLASDKTPELFSEALNKNKDFQPNLITASDNKPVIIGTDGGLFSVDQNAANKIGRFKTAVKFAFDTKTTVFTFNGANSFEIYSGSKKVQAYPLKTPVQATDANLYENNLYVLANNQIIKYNDAGTGSIKNVKWSVDPVNNGVALTADGNIYVLTGDGKLDKYYKGKMASESDLQLSPSAGSRIFTDKASAFIYLTDKTGKRVHVFDKASDQLKTTFKFDSIGAIQDISISQSGAVWILGSDGKVWQIKP